MKCNATRGYQFLDGSDVVCTLERGHVGSHRSEDPASGTFAVVNAPRVNSAADLLKFCQERWADERD